MEGGKKSEVVRRDQERMLTSQPGPKSPKKGRGLGKGKGKIIAPGGSGKVEKMRGELNGGGISLESSLEAQVDKLPLALGGGERGDLEPSLNPLEFNKREGAFLYFYYQEGLEKGEAARQAGYAGKQNSLIVTANRIIKKYVDRGAGRDIFRQVGLDERYLAQKLMASCPRLIPWIRD